MRDLRTRAHVPARDPRAPGAARPGRLLRLVLAGAGLTVAGAGVAPLPFAAPAGAAPGSPSPSPAASDGAPVTTAGTSFLTAVAIDAGRQVRLDASTGDYLYWSFAGSAGQTGSVTVTVTLPPATARHGTATWGIDVFDGLRRRQACTAGAQTAAVPATAATASLDCTLREIRSWAEPWSGDPLPGTYFVRLAALELPDEDLGQPITVDLVVRSRDSGDPVPEGGSMRRALVPPNRPGAVASRVAPSPSASADDGWLPSVSLPAVSTRWLWSAAGGGLAAVAGVLGFRLTRRPRFGRRSRSGRPPGIGDAPPGYPGQTRN